MKCRLDNEKIAMQCYIAAELAHNIMLLNADKQKERKSELLKCVMILLHQTTTITCLWITRGGGNAFAYLKISLKCK